MKPRIEVAHVKVVGVQGMVRVDGEVDPALSELYGRLFGSLTQIPEVRRPYRTVGYWQFVANQERLYFAGIEVDSFARFKWDYDKGLVAWDLGETLWAIWRERNGEEGQLMRDGTCWDWLGKSSFVYDSRFIGDFEIYYWKTPGREPQSRWHEVWLPVVG